jgi:hypothetical protein
MKQIINQTACKAKSIFTCINIFRHRQAKNVLLLLFAGVVFSSCFRHYYKVNSKEVADTALIEQFKAANKYFIFHCDDIVMGTRNLNLVNDQLEAELVALPKDHAHHTKPHLNEKNAMRSKHQSNTLMEVHLYSSTTIPADQKHITLPIGAINRIDIYEMDESSTRQSHILSTVGLAGAGIFIIGTLVLILTGGLVELP